MIEHIYFSGRVQGVGFRFTTKKIAHQIGLTGWVRNLGDGRVEALLCGQSAQIDQSLRELKAYFGDKIRDIDRRSVDSQDSYSGFQIRH